MARKCEFVKETGPCAAYAVTDSVYCQAHKGHAAEPTLSAEQPVVGADLRERVERPARARAKEGPTPEAVGAALQQILMRQEVAERRATALRRARDLPRDSEGRLRSEGVHAAPLKVVPRRSRPDSTQAVDPRTGKLPKEVVPGNVLRWVRTRDHNDRPTQARVADFEDYGYEVVRSADGAVIEGRFGVLMQAPPEQYALRAASNTPKGAMLRDESLDYALDMAESINRTMGEEVTRVVIGDDHKSERVLHSPGREPLDE